ncbi:lipoate--protein ligase family protein [Paenibacillus harenae]|uniref:Octanoyl-[GcvH]:protein N-octanoyltransferase n=1 Tax=Paenibacillus harenae TaxID=306543 RepID=A0ABT9U4V8_PAEHA|nr:lipoate--protein ligase family protein [Paenibacillus harenae]MDQ0114282.1 octanoyl-[GcvH]:protein N-octanoyltransferase [Paenibacillus harenae]
MEWHQELRERMSGVLLLDRMNDIRELDPLHAFALDDWLCRRTGQGGPAICHIWRHPAAFILGMRDSRLPQADVARRWLEAAGWRTAVRHSGGAAVPLDPGVVNVSLIMPKPSVSHMRYHDDFELMYRFVQEALRMTDRQVDRGEIQGAYCPGDYDLSIGGLKFCGIAQRRQTHAFIVQAFVVAEGSGAERAKLVRSFYERAAGVADASEYPLVEPGSTASLEELAGLGPQAGQAFAQQLRRIVNEGQTEAGLAYAAERLAMPTAEELVRAVAALRARYASSSSS